MAGTGGGEGVVQEALTQLSNANSITVFVVCFGLVIYLIIYIFKDKEKLNNERHIESEMQHIETKKMIQKLITLQDGQQLILNRLEITQEYQAKDIQELK